MASSEEKRVSKRKRRLGKGLSALMGEPVRVSADSAFTGPSGHVERDDSVELASGSGVKTPLIPSLEGVDDERRVGNGGSIIFVGLDSIEPNPNQPRGQMDEEALKSLANSIRSAGVMQPILVRRSGGDKGGDWGGKYEIIAGERRWRAARLAGLEAIPAVVRTIEDRESAEWAIIENIQREDLNAMEKAEGFLYLIEYYGLTQVQVAERVGIERSSVANLLRLNQLDQMTKEDIRAGRLSLGHGKALLGIMDTEGRRRLAEAVILGDWSVREAERRVKKLLRGDLESYNQNKGLRGVRGGGAIKPEHIRMLELELEQLVEMKAEIRLDRSRAAGKVIISFRNVGEFERLLDRMKQSLSGTV